MKYNVIIEKTALKFIESQPPKSQQRIYKAIYDLPEGAHIKPMQGKWKGSFRVAVSGYRIIYDVYHDQLLIRVIHADNRGDVYK